MGLIACPGSGRRAGLVPALILAVAAVPPPLGARTGHPDPEIREIRFAAADGLVFPGRLVVPAPSHRNGRGVLLIGGGVANDLEWTTPGFLESGGSRRQFTISGRDHADAPRIAGRLAELGFVVMYWSTIHQADPVRELWPVEATAWTPDRKTGLCRSALQRFRETGLVEADRITLLAHSMGGICAANLAAVDGNIEHLILLAPAQLTRTSAADTGSSQNRESTYRLLSQLDVNEDGGLDPAEYRQARARLMKPASIPFEQLDFFQDGQLSAWELSAGLAILQLQAPGVALQETDRYGLCWTEDILARQRIPTLILYGVLDNAQAHHAPVMDRRIRQESLDHVRLALIPGVGHQLGVEQQGRTGPIDALALNRIIRWLQSPGR